MNFTIYLIINFYWASNENKIDFDSRRIDQIILGIDQDQVCTIRCQKIEIIVKYIDMSNSQKFNCFKCQIKFSIPVRVFGGRIWYCWCDLVVVIGSNGSDSFR